MTWMPDRTAATRGRRLSHTSQNSPHLGSPDRSPNADSGVQSEAHPPQGIPRILGRRARWVGARLRREA